jgi:hypothetical protein
MLSWGPTRVSRVFQMGHWLASALRPIHHPVSSSPHRPRRLQAVAGSAGDDEDGEDGGGGGDGGGRGGPRPVDVELLGKCWAPPFPLTSLTPPHPRPSTCTPYRPFCPSCLALPLPHVRPALCRTPRSLFPTRCCAQHELPASAWPSSARARAYPCMHPPAHACACRGADRGPGPASGHAGGDRRVPAAGGWWRGVAVCVRPRGFHAASVRAASMWGNGRFRTFGVSSSTRLLPPHSTRHSKPSTLNGSMTYGRTYGVQAPPGPACARAPVRVRFRRLDLHREHAGAGQGGVYTGQGALRQARGAGGLVAGHGLHGRWRDCMPPPRGWLRRGRFVVHRAHGFAPPPPPKPWTPPQSP